MAIDTKFLTRLGIKKFNNGTITGLKSSTSKNFQPSISPVDGHLMGAVSTTTPKEYDKVIKAAQKSFEGWKMLPAPRRGDIVRQYGEALRKHKDPLGRLVSYEMGKSLQEGWGEVQEMIDICDFAVGLSRQLYGLTMHSERSMHRMYEQWHPLGIVGVITAFNFPVAVWSWNAMIALVCGDVVVWKPSEKTPLCSIACMNIFREILEANHMPEGIVSVINGDYRVGELLTKDPRVALISATGSTRMGKIVGAQVAARLGRSLLELGGNNAIIVTPKADMKLVMTAAVFGAVGTAGQRCTTTRRLIIHQSIFNKVTSELVKAYKQIKIGNPLDPTVHMGPLIDVQAVYQYQQALEAIAREGGKMLVPGGVLKGKKYASGCYVQPCIAHVKNDMAIVQAETFAPILYVMSYRTLDEAIRMQNNVPQGLSSAIMTDSVKEMEKFISHQGSDCGIANVNIGTSGAEIGGAFGGEKETGGGRESGSDSWKAYMRRQTNTINWSNDLPLAQGINFSL